jgi:hypothetical protein
MKHTEQILALAETLQQLDESTRWLRRSFTRCRKTSAKRDLTPADFDAFEALTSRYARVSDMILQKLFRGLDALELENSGTLLDALNRAEKRGLINSSAEFREIRELRNEISHEYAQENLHPLFNSVLEHTPALLEIVRRSHDYCRRYFPQQGPKKRPLKANP